MAGKKENKKKLPDRFDELIDKFPDAITNDDLKEFLDKRQEMVKDSYIWLSGAAISVAILIASIRVGIGLSETLTTIFEIMGLALVIIVFVSQAPIIIEIGRTSPIHYQVILFEQYLKAKKRLSKMKAAENEMPVVAHQTDQAEDEKRRGTDSNGRPTG